MDYELMMNGNVKIGQIAPEFCATTTMGYISLNDYKGKWLENGVTGYAPFDYQNSINKQVNLWGGEYRLQIFKKK